jgi:hypothetical protein
MKLYICCYSCGDAGVVSARMAALRKVISSKESELVKAKELQSKLMEAVDELTQVEMNDDICFNILSDCNLLCALLSYVMRVKITQLQAQSDDTREREASLKLELDQLTSTVEAKKQQLEDVKRTRTQASQLLLSLQDSQKKREAQLEAARIKAAELNASKERLISRLKARGFKVPPLKASPRSSVESKLTATSSRESAGSSSSGSSSDNHSATRHPVTTVV